ncbi:MAG: DUF4199 domain-containing protein [Lewinellaceae bacterium]|nr:DUF4199 domain-containing protein [Lewinella sp.]MCB9277626.1 DUF4199 domain-containing protein [Lewinellaceae bacterium]
MKKTILTFGLIAGAIQGILMLILMGLFSPGADAKSGELIGYATMILSLSMIFFGIRSYRNNQPGGAITFGKAFKLGLLIALIAAALYVIIWLLYYYFGDGKSLMDAYFNQAVEQIRQSGEPAQAIEQKVKEMEKFKEIYKNPIAVTGFTFLENFPVGLVIALISAALLRRQPQAQP